jgi:hypothetical protein
MAGPRGAGRATGTLRLRSNLRIIELFEFVTNSNQIESYILIRKFVTNRIEFETKIRKIRTIRSGKKPRELSSVT